VNLKRWFISYLWHSSVLSRQIVPPRRLRCFFEFLGAGRGRFPFTFPWLRVIGDDLDEEAPSEPSSSESPSSDPSSVWQNINKLVIQANPNYSGGSSIRISHRDEYPYITLLKRPIDVVWINYDSTHVLRVFTQSTWSKFQDIFRVYFLEWLADKFLQGDDRGQAELFLSKINCIDILKAQNWSDLYHASNWFWSIFGKLCLIRTLLKCMVPTLELRSVQLEWKNWRKRN